MKGCCEIVNMTPLLAAALVSPTCFAFGKSPIGDTHAGESPSGTKAAAASNGCNQSARQIDRHKVNQ